MAHSPLKISYTAQPLAGGKMSLTFRFEHNPRYVVNLTPQPKLDIVRGERSVLLSKIVPANLGKDAASSYYGAMAPVEVTVDRDSGLEARITYFFCSKADGFCARKTDSVPIHFP